MIPEVSIVIPCLRTPKDLVKDIKRQTFKSYEIVLSKGKMPIPRAYNNGVRMAKGKRIIFLGDDVRVYERNWLAEMVKLIDKYKLVRPDTMLVNQYGFSSDNVGIMADLMKKNLFDETYVIGEDTEWYERMRSKNHKVVRARQPIVWHFKRMTVNKVIKWSFYAGVAYARIALQYKDPEEDFKRIIMSRGYALTAFLAMLAGEVYAFVRYFYTIFNKR